MNSFHALRRNNSTKGWRHTAVINTIAVTTFTLFVVILLAWSSSRSGGGVDSNLIFFNGDCAKSRSVNLWLHLLLNTCSTAVIASSNFFMQVLSSPTRGEIDKAHRENNALEIGVPSLSNIFQVAWFKGICWFLFFASSFPIHLFFNSAIFATEYKGSDFHLTIASDAFIDGADYSGPGAVLWRAGAPETDPVSPGYGSGYGSVVNATEYFDSNSEALKNIEFAAQSSRAWKRLEVPECLSRYVYCDTHNEFRDVVWVVKSHNPSGNFMIPSDNNLGWRGVDLLDSMSPLDGAFWNRPYFTRGNNSLWFAANCTTSVYFNRQTHTTSGCYQSCNSATGHSSDTFDPKSAEFIPPNYTFDFFPALGSYSDKELSQMHWPGLIDPSAATLDLEYCLAEEVSTTCKVGLSNKILLIVLVCLIIKVVACIIVLYSMRQKEPLVVPGDAVVSFICSPDKPTLGRCTLNRSLASSTTITGRYAATPKPTQWRTEPRRNWASAITTWVWARSYLLFVLDIIIVAALFGVSQKSNPLGSSNQTLSQSATNGILSTNGETASALLSSVLTANMPQLLLSLSYFVYNSLYTRLCTEKEWNSYAVEYRPLRVSRPQGRQRSTYRLQLPYQYSIPLILISILLHWLVSNALYVFVLEGGYYWIENTGSSTPGPALGTGLSDDAYIGIGYSTIALLAIFIAAIVLSIIPIALSRTTLKSSMLLGGSNSLVISAACHIPLLEERQPIDSQKHHSNTTMELQSVPAVEMVENDRSTFNDEFNLQQDTEAGTFEMQRLLGLDQPVSSKIRTNEDDEHSSKVDLLDVERYLVDASQQPIRWGAVKASSCDQQCTDQGDVIGHLSFGTREHNVQEPVDGQWYM